MIKRVLLGVSFSLIALQPLHLANAAPAQGQALPAQPGARTQTFSWLGVTLETIPTALSTQLSELIPPGQGVMVQAVSPDSPAAKAGIKQHDILLSFGDQKLYSPQQLSGLVRAAAPDSRVNMKIVQQGKLKDLAVTIGSRTVTAPQPWGMPRSWQNRMAPPVVPPAFQNRPNFGQGMQPQPQQQGMVWDSFQSVQVNTLPDGRYRASVSYKDANNEVKEFTFEGKKEEIIAQIDKQQDIPEDKKQALLNALDMRMDWQMNDMFNHPFFRNNGFFNDPFFRNGFGQDPFFRHGFPPMPDPGRLFQHQRQKLQVPELKTQGEIL